MKFRIGLALALGLTMSATAVPGCESPTDAPADGGHGHAHPSEGHVFTTWVDDTEVFVEFPPLVVGERSPFAVHVTRLSDFEPIAEGRVRVELSGGETFTADASKTPGIFRPEVQPRQSGRHDLSIVVDADGREVVHELGTVEVWASREAIPNEDAGDGEQPGAPINFLKEQQWRTPFSTARAETRTLRPSLAVVANFEARADGEVIVAAPATGRLVAKGSIPVVGTYVEEDQLLAHFLPRLEGSADVASLDLAVTAARLELDRAERERERLETLFSDGAVAERRVQDARYAEASARADLTAARKRARQFQRVQRAGKAKAASAVEVRAPIAGELIEVDAVAGAFVEDGTALFRIVDTEALWLVLHVPEGDAGALEGAAGAWFELPGGGAVVEVPAESLVHRGQRVDPVTRTIDVIYEVANVDGRLRVGASIHARLADTAGSERVSVPELAVVRDAGVDHVFVQVGGESFQRRSVRVGTRDRGWIHILDGVDAGERVVVEGAYTVKLASNSSSAPAHGHPH